MRVEGFLYTRVDKGKAIRHYVIIDGYVLRTFADETNGMESEMEALSTLDLRALTHIEPEDTTHPPPRGPCVLVGKVKGKQKGKALVIDPAQLHDPGAIDGHTDTWWIKHVTCAVPEQKVDPILRKFRHPDTVVALMTECSQQPSAEKLSDKEWRKAYYHPDSFAKKSGSGKTASGKTGGILGLFRRSSGSHSSVGSGEQSPRTPGGVADILAKAHMGREHGEQPRLTLGGAEEEFYDEEQHEKEEAEARAAKKRAGKMKQKQQEPVDVADDERPPTQEEIEAEERREAEVRKRAAERTAALKQAAIEKREREEQEAMQAAEARAERAEIGVEEHPGEWWFVSDDEGIHGPFDNKEMRRRYIKGLVHETSLVRFLPFAEEPPKADAQDADMFAPLQELCTAAGPPFMEA